jgi:putative restriction endonuclease
MLAPILVTDHDWFEYLAGHGPFDEVNFWRPLDQKKPSWQVGTPALFKLRKPYGGWIVGFGLFARHELAPAWLAWDAFGDKNGAADFNGMLSRLEELRKRAGATAARASKSGDFTIGCIMLFQPVFLPSEAWVLSPTSGLA